MCQQTILCQMGITYVTTDQEGRHGRRLLSQSGMFLWMDRRP
jgi:hypothetical protein